MTISLALEEENFNLTFKMKSLDRITLNKKENFEEEVASKLNFVGRAIITESSICNRIICEFPNHKIKINVESQILQDRDSFLTYVNNEILRRGGFWLSEVSYNGRSLYRLEGNLYELQIQG